MNREQELFTELMKQKQENEDKAIYTISKKKSFIPEENETFVQCWADTPKRKDLPKYWFLSEKENLITISKGKLNLVQKNYKDDGKKYYYKTSKKDKNGKYIIKNIAGHNLQWLVFGARTFGDADRLLNEKGLYAFGTSANTLNGHHIDGNGANNAISNGEILTSRFHQLLTHVPKIDTDIGVLFKWYDKVIDSAEKENITTPFLITTGEYKRSTEDSLKTDGDVFIQEITHTEELAQVCKETIGKMELEILLTAIIKKTIKRYGKEYFVPNTNRLVWFTETNMVFILTTVDSPNNKKIMVTAITLAQAIINNYKMDITVVTEKDGCRWGYDEIEPNTEDIKKIIKQSKEKQEEIEMVQEQINITMGITTK